jgi:hypothetical protein
MPVNLEWHSSLPVLQTTYKGALSANEYSAMYRRRLEMLDEASSPVILLVDAQGLESFPDATNVKRSGNVLLHGNVFRTLVVMPESLYHRLSRVAPENGLPVRFYASLDRALDAAGACRLSSPDRLCSGHAFPRSLAVPRKEALFCSLWSGRAV